MTDTGRIYENDATSILRMIEGVAGQNSQQRFTAGFGGGQGGAQSGGTSITTPPAPPALTSPYYQTTLTVPNSGTDTLNFGPAVSVVAANAFYYAQRNSAIVEVGEIEIWIDGAGNAQIVPVEDGGDVGITFTISAASGDLILTATADGSGDITTIRLTYEYEGLSVSSVFGVYEATRGSLVEKGKFGVAQAAGAAYDYRRARGDDTGISFAGTISSGILELSVAADGSDGNATAIVFDYLIVAAGGGTQWAKQALAVNASSSNEATFEAVASGAIIWDTGAETIPANSSGSPIVHTFTSGDGALYAYYQANRGDLIETGQLKIWNDLSTGLFIQNSWLGDVGMTLSGSFSSGQLRLTAYCDNSDALDTALRLVFVSELQIV